METKKITLSTIKSFINKNRERLFINVKFSFDGIIDCVSSLNHGFVPAKKDKTESKCSDYYKSTQGIEGAWFVGCSRDYFEKFEDGNLIGYKISNSCGSFILATNK